jgi:hypothetical protein
MNTIFLALIDCLSQGAPGIGWPRTLCTRLRRDKDAMRQSAKCTEHFACVCYQDEITRLETRLKELHARLQASQSETAAGRLPRLAKKSRTKMKARSNK